jgi:hypothetical protein
MIGVFDKEKERISLRLIMLVHNLIQSLPNFFLEGLNTIYSQNVTTSYHISVAGTVVNVFFLFVEACILSHYNETSYSCQSDVFYKARRNKKYR